MYDVTYMSFREIFYTFSKAPLFQVLFEKKLLTKARPRSRDPQGARFNHFRYDSANGEWKPDSSPNPLLCLAAGQAAEVQNFIHTSGVWYPASSYYPPSGVYIGSN